MTDQNWYQWTRSAMPPPLRSLSVVLPAHNEEGNIEFVVRQALEVLPSVASDFEVLIVDDGSVDRTGAIADELAAQDRRVKALHHRSNRGYGCSWRSGVEAATGDWIFFMDSDRQFDVRDISRLTAFARENDIVAGYRIKRRDPQYRFLVGSCFNILVTLLFHVHLRDIDCGFKMFRTALLKSMTLEAPGALINTEIHAKANMVGARLVEVGITHYPRPVGRQSGTRLKVILRAVWEIAVLRIHLSRYAAQVGQSLDTECVPAAESSQPST